MAMLFAYNVNNQRVSNLDSARAILNIPLKRFKRTKGCSGTTGNLLKPKDIGKKYKVEILDPVQMGVCTFLGFGLDAIPESGFKKLIQEKLVVKNFYLVFEKSGKNKCTFIVSPHRCDVTPV